MYIKEIENLFVKKNKENDEKSVQFLIGCNKLFYCGDSFFGKFQSQQNCANENEVRNRLPQNAHYEDNEKDIDEVSDISSSLLISSLLSISSENYLKSVLDNSQDVDLITETNDLHNNVTASIENIKTCSSVARLLREESVSSFSSISTISLDATINQDNTSYIRSIYSRQSSGFQSRYGFLLSSYSILSLNSFISVDGLSEGDQTAPAFHSTCIQNGVGNMHNTRHIYPIVYCNDVETNTLVRIDCVYDPVHSFGPKKNWFQSCSDKDHQEDAAAIEVIKSYSGHFEKKMRCKNNGSIFRRCIKWLKKKVTSSVSCL